MAIAIKSIPILKSRVADTFTKKVLTNDALKGTINFKEQTLTATKILAKAKI